MRRSEGKETWHRLLEWDRGRASSERLAAIILSNVGFRNIDPSHPLGGKDGLKDMVLSFNGKRWIGAVFFPRGQQRFSDIKSKFSHDLSGCEKNEVKGFVFFTNQEICLSERKILTEMNDKLDIQIYHLERIASLLNSPLYYGIRMEFLDIEMTKEEQLSFFASQNERMSNIEASLEKLYAGLDDYKAFQKILLCKKQDRNVNAEESEEFYKSEFRSLEEIRNSLEQLFDKIWFDRHLTLRYNIETCNEKVDPEIWENALTAAQSIIEKYGEDNLGPYSDFEWGMLNGKLSALRWVVGDEWDVLDT